MAIAKKESGGELRAVLTYWVGGNQKEAIKLRRDSTIFGREKGDVLIDDEEISSTHFQIQNINGVYHIFDMNSTNGTFVNKQRIVRAKLSPSDTITAGKTSFEFSLEKESKVRHIATIFQASNQKASFDQRVSLVDTLIENELKDAKSWGILIKVRYRDGFEEKIKIKQNIAYIGRASSFGQFDKDTEISRRHLMIKVNDSGEIFIEDQGSTNGSFINNVAFQGMHPVNPSDTIKVGLCTLNVESFSI
jgi:pSer/pThr/pTyr-binding forkhead associated (FHA) protein